jgi:hypothetical protein
LGGNALLLVAIVFSPPKIITLIFFALLLTVIMVVVARLLLFSRASDAGYGGLYTMELLELMGSVSYGLKMIMLGEKKATSNEWEISSLIAKEIIWCESYLTPKGEQLVKR